MGQSDIKPADDATQKAPSEQRDAVTTDSTTQDPAKAPGFKQPEQPENPSGIRSGVGTAGNREAQKTDASETGGERAAGVPAPKEGGPDSRR